MHTFIGIDIGTGSVKAIALNESGAFITKSQKEYPTYHSIDSHVQDPGVICSAVFDCLNEVVNKLNGGDALTITFSAAMHSLLAVDVKGDPLTPLIIWSDTRSADLAETLKNSAEGEALYYATGTPIHAMTPLCKIRWLKENNAGIFKETHKFISIKEYVWWKLFGVYEIDHSIASATGLFSIEHLSWQNEALNWAGISVKQLSTPVPTIRERQLTNSKIAGLLNIPPSTKFIIGASDGCLANLGSFAMQPGTAAITIGSSGAVRVASNAPILHFPAMPFSYRLKEEIFICGGAINNGGIVIQWLLKTFLDIEKPDAADYISLFKLIEPIKPGCEGLVFLPYLTGERAPVWDAKTCGTFFGLSIHHTKAHILRAGVEGVCFAINETLQMVEQKTNAIEYLHVSGGFTHAPLWLQLIANVTGKKIKLMQTEDASAVGAAYLAMQTSGYKYNIPDVTMTIEPEDDKYTIYQKSFSIYKSLYPSLKDVMHQFYQLNH